MMELIHNWRKAYRMLSVQAMSLAAALQGAWVYIPDDMKTHIPANLITGVTVALLVLGIIGRMVKQPTTDTTPPQ